MSRPSVNLQQTTYLRYFGSLITSFCLVFSLACATHNIVQAPTGRFQSSRHSINTRLNRTYNLGRRQRKEIDRSMPVMSDSEDVSRYVQRLGQQLVSHNRGDVKWPFSFHGVNVKEINAFVLPGGPIYVNVGTLQAADDEGQLAGVIAHEISHVVLRHSTQQASQASLVQVPLAILGASVGRSATGQLAALGANIGAQGLLLKYSRTAETEADLLGSQIMYDADYNPYSMVEFFTKLESQGGPGVPQFLSDHPNPGNRVENVRQAINKYPKKKYRNNSGDFDEVKAAVGKMRPSNQRPGE